MSGLKGATAGVPANAAEVPARWRPPSSACCTQDQTRSPRSNCEPFWIYLSQIGSTDHGAKDRSGLRFATSIFGHIA